MPSGSHRRPLDFWQLLCRGVGGFCVECCMRAFCFGQFLADLGRFLADSWQILVDFRHISFARAAAKIYNIWIFFPATSLITQVVNI